MQACAVACDMGAEWNDLLPLPSLTSVFLGASGQQILQKTREWRQCDEEHSLLRMFWTWEQPLLAMAFATARAAVLEIELQHS